VTSVAYPSLPSSPYHALAGKYFPRGSGATLAVSLDGGLRSTRAMVERLRVFDFTTNVGNSRSTISRTATWSYSGLVIEIASE
jgi:O-acetylhomoserine (thiol)-lyase